MFYKQLLYTLLFNFLALLAISQNNITLQTVFQTTDQLFALKANGDQIIWTQVTNNSQDIHYYDGNSIQILPTPTNFSPSGLALTETVVAWTVDNTVNNGGGCASNVPFSMALFDGVTQMNNTPCSDWVSSNGDSYLISYNFGPTAFQIYDANNELVFQMPTTYQGSGPNAVQFTFSISNIISYWGDYIYFKGFTNFGGSSNQTIFKYDVKQDIFTDIFSDIGDVFITIPTYKHDSTMVVMSQDVFTFETALYYHDGVGGSTLIIPNSNVLNSEVLIFNDQVIWVTTNSELIRYDVATAVIDTMENDSVGFQSLNASDCYLAWSIDDFSNFESTLHFYDGVNTVTQNFDGVFNSFNTLQIDNEGFSTVLFEFISATVTEIYTIVQGKFDVACCTGENIITNKNPDETSSNFIESSTLFTCNLNPVYNAVDYIQCDPGLKSPLIILSVQI